MTTSAVSGGEHGLEVAEARAAAARVVATVLEEGRSLTSALPPQLAKVRSARARAAAQDLAYNTLRFALRLQPLLESLLDRPLKRKDAELQALLLVGLTQLLELDTPAHAAVASTVAACSLLDRDWAKGFCNAVLRRADRERLALLARRDQIAHAHPGWLVDALETQWPADAAQVLAAGNRAPPMTLRVNVHKRSRVEALARLETAGLPARPCDFASAGIRLDRPCDTQAIPGFADGELSVQDEAAQFAVTLLDLQPGLSVLDACAAPGGKTAQLLESQVDLGRVLALDVDAERCRLLSSTLRRLGLAASVKTADATTPAAWWDGRPFDRILLDAPCSATGVIRRHPDIKHLRTPADIERLTLLQDRLLQALWPLLAPGGILLYITCSMLPAEGSERIAAFLAREPGARALPLAAEWARSVPHGLQILPGDHDMDGFYYACLVHG